MHRGEFILTQMNKNDISSKGIVPKNPHDALIFNILPLNCQLKIALRFEEITSHATGVAKENLAELSMK